MSKKFFTVMFIPPSSKSVKKWVISDRSMRALGYGAAGLLGLFVVMALLSYGFFNQRATMRKAKNQVQFLENNLKAVENSLAAAEATLARIQNFEQKLRVITRLEDSNRNLAMGPLTKADDPFTKDNLFKTTEVLDADLDVPAEYRFEVKEANIKLSEVGEKATLQEQTMHELYELLQDQKALLSHTPSVWPVKGWVTSRFGYRASPFTGRIQMHEGLDIAARMGMPVIAPADGVIIRVHTLEGYGKTLVIDHGYGVVSRYGHNSEILVKPGDRVKRGDVVAKVGNTGISTAPHLHYELRVNGVPVDPMKYILD